MSIKYYRLAKDEELPEEFCAVRDVNGEPSEYTWYERMSNFERELWVLFTQSESGWFAGSEYRKLQAENAKLREEVGAAKHDLSIFSRRIVELDAENAKLRDALKALMMGTNVELCADRDASQCQECSMALDEHRCAMSNAILLLGIDMYGEPLGGE